MDRLAALKRESSPMARKRSFDSGWLSHHGRLRPVRLRHLIHALMLLGVVGLSLPAFAQPLKAEVLVVLARASGDAIDPQLKDVEALRKPPFSSFKSMKVIEKSTLQTDVDKPAELQLPNGRTMQVALIKARPDGRFQVRVSINKPDTKDYLPGMEVIASPGEPFFVAGQKYQGGTLVVGVRVGGK